MSSDLGNPSFSVNYQGLILHLFLHQVTTCFKFLYYVTPVED